jgi:hypothetical protein
MATPMITTLLVLIAIVLFVAMDSAAESHSRRL